MLRIFVPHSCILMLLCFTTLCSAAETASMKVAIQSIFDKALAADEFDGPVMRNQADALKKVLQDKEIHDEVVKEMLARVSKTRQGTSQWWALSYLITIIWSI